MGQGKSFPAFSVENQVTLHETVGRNVMGIKDHPAPDKLTKKKKQLSHDVSLTKGPPNKGPQTGYLE
jgi:hypothetical protein